MIPHPLSPACLFFQAEDGIRYDLVTGVQTCALPISVHTVTSVDDAPPVLPDEPPSEQAASRKVVPRPSATARGFSLAKSIELPHPISTPVSGRGRSRRQLCRRTFAYVDVGYRKSGSQHCQSSPSVLLNSEQSQFGLGL